MSTTWKPFYRIKPGSSGSFLCPPGHPNLKWSLWGYESARHRNEMSIGSLDNALADDFDGSDAIKARVQRIFDEAELIPSEMWIRKVYGYFRSSYAPETKPGEAYDRNVSNAVFHDPTEIAVNAARKALAEYFAEPPEDTHETEGQGVTDPKSYRDGSERPMRAARRGWEVTATRDGSEVFVYALADDGSRYGSLPILERYAEALKDTGFADARVEAAQNDGAVFVPERVRATNPVPIEPLDPARHLAVLCVQEYFPDHEPRLDLIENPGKGYDAQPCAKCGGKVQYEAKFDALTVVSTRIVPGEGTVWTYGVECPSGGGHTTSD